MIIVLVGVGLFFLGHNTAAAVLVFIGAGMEGVINVIKIAKEV